MSVFGRWAVWFPPLLWLLLIAPGSGIAAPSDDIKGYCDGIHESYRYRLLCVREEEAAKGRLYRQKGMPFGIPREVWDYCARVHSSWRYMEICARDETAAKREYNR